MLSSAQRPAHGESAAYTAGRWGVQNPPFGTSEGLADLFDRDGPTEPGCARRRLDDLHGSDAVVRGHGHRRPPRADIEKRRQLQAQRLGIGRRQGLLADIDGFPEAPVVAELTLVE